MLDMKPVFCQLSSTSHINPENFNRTFSSCSTSNFSKPFVSYDNNICYINNHSQLKCIERYRTKYPYIPKSSQILDKKRSILLFKEKIKSIEPIFKEKSTKYIQSQSINIHHIGSQTIYREESTQTDPYSPVYTISNGEHPEVFILSDFTYGKGLPATSLEISFIERIRARHAWEQNQTVDLTRTKIVIEREIREWQLREKEIEMLEDARHKLFTNNLHTYIQTDEDLTQNRIDLSIYRQEKQLKLKHQQLEMKTSRDIRRIKRIYRLREAQINAVTSYNHLGIIGMAQRGNGCVSSLKPPWHTRSDDIITIFKNNFSKISTSCPHFDYLIDRRMNQLHINIFELEQLIPKNALISQIDGSKLFQNKHNTKLNRQIRDLDKAYQLIQKEKTKHLLTTSSKKPSLRFVEKIETIDHIQQLQTIPTQTEAHDQRRISIIKLQNYLRSIILQSKISNVYKIRQDLLNELKSDQILSLNNSTKSSTQIYDYFTDATIADMLDFLSKELLRLQCEQTIQLFILLADRHRYQREAKESGTRTKSIEQQKLEDQAFQEMFLLDLNCDIEIYLQDLILESITNTANEQAKLEIKQITEILIKLTNEINFSSLNQSDIEAIVADLVHNFLFPTVQKILTQHKLHQNITT